MKLLPALFASLALTTLVHAQVPPVLSYQGQVAVDGTNGYACFAEAVRDWAAGLTPTVDLAPI